MRELHLFAGIGGGILGGMLLGHECVGAVEKEPFCRDILRARFPDLPIHNDVETYEGRPGSADIVAGGFPCQDISAAGKGKGLKGERSGLWFQMLRVVGEVEPSYVFLENSPLLRTRGLDTILSGLSELGFDAEWGVFSAASVGAPHLRKRLWLLGAHPDRARRQQLSTAHDLEERQHVAPWHIPHRLRSDVPDPLRSRLPEWQGTQGQWAQSPATGSGWWLAEPDVGRLVDEAASRLDRSRRVAQIKALGNAQIPLVAATAFRMLRDRFTLNP